MGCILRSNWRCNKLDTVFGIGHRSMLMAARLCDVGGTTVLQIYIYASGLVGAMPHEIGNWVDVKTVQLSGNHLTGPLPSSLGNWTQLEEFYAYNNELSGTLPPSVGKWIRLRVFDVFHNKLVGSITSSWAIYHRE